MITARYYALPVVLALLPNLSFAKLDPIPTDAVAPHVAAAASMFDLADVTLGPGAMRDAMERDRGYLLQLEPERLLHTFRLNVGIPSTARPYGGWEAPDVELRGHSTGHYLSACALMYRATGDERFRQRIDVLVDGLSACQDAAVAAGFHKGYLSAFPESFIDRVEAGQPVWAPWYTLHKIMAGLLDAHRLAGNAKARKVLVAMTGWVVHRVERLSTEQMQTMLKAEFGGMNDVLGGVYALTGDPRHLQVARAFDHAALFDPLARGEDELDGLHANTQIPKVIGAAREYLLTGDTRYRDIARVFWERVALHRTYAIGGNSDREHFFPTSEFARHVGPETAETCNTYNMLKLTRALFEQDSDARLIDFYERGLYNHILASQDPAQGMFVYLMALEPGHFKTYSTAEDSFWCCVGTGMENHAKYGEAIFAQQDGALLVNLFVPASVEWRERGVRLTQATSFPEESTTTLGIECDQPSAFVLKVRHPGWADGALMVSLNGEPERALESSPGSYAAINRTWRSGDRVSIRLPVALRAEPLPGSDNVVALFYGPIALAAGLGTDGMPLPYAGSQLDLARIPHPVTPVLCSEDADWLARVEKISESPLLFRTRGIGRPHDVVLRPFHAVHHERMALYWPLISSAQWEAREAAVAAVGRELGALRSVAIDRVVAGDATSEASHGLVAVDSRSGAVSGLTWRQAKQKGCFSYSMSCGGRQDLSLLLVVGARDRDRQFDVFLGSTRLPIPDLDGQAPGLVRLVRLPIPAELTSGQEMLNVRLQSRGSWDSATASMFECLLVPSD